MKTHQICLIVFLCCFMFFQRASAINTDLSSYITMLEEAAEVCDNSMFSTSKCSKVCTASAEKFKQVKTLSGLSADAKNAILNCMTAMAANDDGRNSPLFNQIGALQATLSSALLKLKIADYGKQALATENATLTNKKLNQVSIDTNIYDANGQVDSKKIPALYDDLKQKCENQTCTYICRNKKSELTALFETINQAPQNISTADRERNTNNLMSQIVIDLKLGCASQYNSSIYKERLSEQEPKSYAALIEFVDLIKNGSWPPKPMLRLDLDLDEEELTPEEKQASQIASLTAVGAITSFSFSQAVTLIKSMPDYRTLDKEANFTPYNATQVYTSLTKLMTNEKSYANKRQQWQDKVQQLGLAGRQKNLHEAINSQCDIDYIRTYSQNKDWQLNIQFNPAPLEQNINPVYLHRLCYEQIADSLISKYEEKNNIEGLQTLADSYISKSPVNRVGSFNAVASNEIWMSDENWLPSWAKYKQKRVTEFAAKDKLVAQEKLIIQQEKDQQHQSINAERLKYAKNTKQLKNKDVARIVRLKQQRSEQESQKVTEKRSVEGHFLSNRFVTRMRGREVLTGLKSPSRNEEILHDIVNLKIDPNINYRDILKLTSKNAYYEFSYDQAVQMIKQSQLYKSMLEVLIDDISGEILYEKLQGGAVRFQTEGKTDTHDSYKELVSAKVRGNLFNLLSYPECKPEVVGFFNTAYTPYWDQRDELFHFYGANGNIDESAPLEKLITVQFLQRMCAKEQFSKDKLTLKMGDFINERAIELYEKYHVATIKNKDGMSVMPMQDWAPSWSAFKDKWYEDNYKPRTAMFVEANVPFPDIDRSAIIQSTVFAPVSYGKLINAYQSVASSFSGSNNVCELSLKAQISLSYLYKRERKSESGILAQSRFLAPKSKQYACSRAIKSNLKNRELSANETIIIQFEDMQAFNYWSLRPNQFPSGELRKYCDVNTGRSPFQGLSQCEYWSAIYYNDFEQAFMLDRLYSSFMKHHDRRYTASAIWDSVSFYNTQYQETYQQCLKPSSAKKYEFEVKEPKKLGWVFRGELNRTNYYSYYVNQEWIPIMNEIGFTSVNYINTIKDSAKLKILDSTAFVTAKYIAGLMQAMEKYSCDDPVIKQLETRMKSYYEATQNYAAIYNEKPQKF